MALNNTIQAYTNKRPPSFCTTMPNFKICEAIAPVMMPMANNAPGIMVAGKSNNTAAISSIQPVAIRPQGSTPN